MHASARFVALTLTALLAAACGKQQFSDVRRQRDDALRWFLQCDGLAVVLQHRDRRLCR